jgi:HEAT repeat protein
VLDLLHDYEEEAERQRRAAISASRDQGETRANWPASPTASESFGRARDRAASAIGTSGRSVARAKAVATKAPDLAEKVDQDPLTSDPGARHGFAP